MEFSAEGLLQVAQIDVAYLLKKKCTADNFSF